MGLRAPDPLPQAPHEVLNHHVVPNVTVLGDGSGNQVGRTTHERIGYIRFTNLSPGAYVVECDRTTTSGGAADRAHR